MSNKLTTETGRRQTVGYTDLKLVRTTSRYTQGRRAGCCVYDSPLELKSAVIRPDIPFPLEFTKIGSVMVNHEEPKIALVTIHFAKPNRYFL